MASDYHDLKTRRSGSYRFVELHLEMPPEMPLEKVHDYCDYIEEELKKQNNNLRITIHAEPAVDPDRPV